MSNFRELDSVLARINTMSCESRENCAMVSSKGRHARRRSDWHKADDEFFQESYPSGPSNANDTEAGYEDIQGKTLKIGDIRYTERIELDDRIAKIKTRAEPMGRKRILLREARDEPSPRSEIVGPISAHRKQACHNTRICWRDNAKLFVPFTALLKSIQGRFGSGLASYFIFMRWLLALNLVMSLFMLLFVVLPAISGNAESGSICNKRDPFSAECCHETYENSTLVSTGFDAVFDFATGTGWLELTHLFYGHYPNVNVRLQFLEWTYVFPLAYILTCSCCFLVSFMWIVYEAAKGFRESLVNEKGSFHVYCNVVFAGWDFSIKSPKSAAVEHSVITNELKSLLHAEIIAEKRKSMQSSERWKLRFKRMFGHFCATATLFGSGFAIYYASKLGLENARISDGNQTKEEIAGIEVPDFVMEYVPSVTITVLNVVIPPLFGILSVFEGYSPDQQVNFQILRTIGLRLASIFFLMASFYSIMCPAGSFECTGTKCKAPPCWETYVGQELYKLVWVDLVFSLAMVFIVGSLRKVVSSAIPLLQVDFDLPRQVVDLVYSQSLCWLSILFSPLAPLLHVLKFLVVFYVKQFHLKVICAPSLLLYRASKSKALFMGALLLSFLAVTLPIGLLVLEVPPSRSCGPFRGRTHMWGAVVDSIKEWPVWIKAVFGFLTTAGFVVPALIVLILCLYYYYAMAAAHRSMVSRLQDQLILENRDKQFLREKLEALKKSTGRSSVAEATPLRST
ncbi:unnamed protein product [Notodromas monacha]|uniref:TMC domain-containing protein n=1 Tax=Notodromas monacha TaxID=399045 RepID=A0A7R9BPK6_9CRUS|nr:unnamed protein product [Notodromas monacha]CAG0918461.1 unnamed protein product [Notodromas monacha]